MKRIVLALLLFSSAAYADDGILIIGDSISLGYTPYVQEVLPCVVHAPGNNRDSYTLMMTLIPMLEGKHYRIIHFNAGLWDIARRIPTTNDPWTLDPTDMAPVTNSIADYKIYLTVIINIMQAYEPDAQIIFATSTDVPKDSIGRLPKDLDAYNHAAVQTMNDLGVQIDSIHTFMLPYANLHIDQDGNRVHYSDAGYRILAWHEIQVLSKAGGC